MRTAGLALLIILGIMPLSGAEIVVQKVRGDVHLRQGVTEVWNRVAVGDVLKPDDTMKTGPTGTAVILVPDGSHDKTLKRVTLPPDVMVDISDIRELSQEELMLKLAMEKVRSSSSRPTDDGLKIPNASVVHGTDREGEQTLPENEIAVGILQINGTRVLFENGFYSTCALKAMELFRLFPPLGERFGNRLLVAEALERAHLKGEALNEYGAILNLPELTAAQESLVHARMEQLRK
jgi:hypothetical protein